MFVSYFGPVEKVQLLLERGVDVNLKNQSGMTAIFFAAQAKQSAIVNLLLNAGADLNIKDDLGLSAIDYTHFTSREVASLIRSKSANLLSALEIFLEAIRSGDLNFLKANLFDSVSVEEAQKYAYPLFSEAIHFKKHEILLALFAYYKTADFLDQGKNTLLHFAIEQENIKAIRFLIEKGINPNQKNDLELSSLDIALSQNNEAIWIALSPQNRFFKIHNGNDLNGAKNATEFCESKNLTCNDASIDSNAILSGTYFWSHNECKNYNAFPGFCHPEMRFGGYWQDRSCSNTDLAQNSISNVPKIIACNTASEGKTLYPFLIQAEPDAKGAQTAKAFCAAQDLSCHSVLWEKISDSSLQLSECSKTITLEDQSEIEIDGAQIINLNFLKSKRIIYCE